MAHEQTPNPAMHMPQPTLEYDKDANRWIATWDKPDGSGLIAQATTREQALEQFRNAWDTWHREHLRGG